MMKVRMLAIVGMSGLMLAGCVSGNTVPPADATPAKGAIGMPNPASVYCLNWEAKKLIKQQSLV